jgi:hypothetical protein
MVDLSKKQLTGVVTLAMVIAGAVGISVPENTYYCESRDVVLQCDRLSSTGLTCYFELGSKRCPEGWKLLDAQYIPDSSPTIPSTPVIGETRFYTQSPDGKFCYPNGLLNAKMLCEDILKV